MESLQRGRRNLDGFWWVDERHADLVLLMPMTGESGLESFMLRTEKCCRTITPSPISVRRASPIHTIVWTAARCWTRSPGCSGWTMFASVRFLVYALFLEFGSLYLMLSGSDSRWGLLTYLALHTLASLAMARGVWGLLPRHYQEPVGATQLLLFSLALFVPLVGLVAMLIGVGIGYALPAVSREEPFVMVRVPSFTPVPAPSGAGFRQEDLRTLLTSPETSTEMRLQGMLTVRDMPTRFTGSVLREVLGDAVDDVRLLAYGILDQKKSSSPSRSIAPCGCCKPPTRRVPTGCTGGWRSSIGSWPIRTWCRGIFANCRCGNRSSTLTAPSAKNPTTPACGYCAAAS